jgi:hypothetical protein
MAGRHVLISSLHPHFLSNIPHHFRQSPKGSHREDYYASKSLMCAGCDKVTCEKHKVNGNKICHPTKFGGLGILHLEKFAATLRLRWIWLEWVDEIKVWIGLGNPCNESVCKFFEAATIAMVGEMATFWKYLGWTTFSQRILCQRYLRDQKVRIAFMG